MSDLAFMSIATAGERLRRGELSAIEYAQALVEHARALDGRLHAYLRPCPDQALADARRAQSEIDAGAWRGPMHGIPYGLKDVIDYAGLPTTANSATLLDNVPVTHATVTRRLVSAGAVMMGKLALHELSIGGPSQDLPWPVPVNPWADSHFAGGSSSGAAVAVAAGMLPAAIGTDTGGSVRSPAANCGVVGMKPTRGLVSRTGVIPLAYSLDCMGVLTRSVRDNAIVLATIAASSSKPAGGDTHAAERYLESIDAGVAGLKIGVVRHFHAEEDLADPEQLAAIDDAAALLARLGAKVSELRLPARQDYSTCCGIILLSEAYAIFRELLSRRASDLGELARSRILVGAAISAADYIDAQRWRARLTRITNERLGDFDGVITSTNFDPAYPLDDQDAMTRALSRHSRHPFSLTGHPAMSVPAGFTRGGLPLSMQVVGAYFDEATVYRIANAYERATDWAARRPPGLAATPHAA